MAFYGLGGSEPTLGFGLGEVSEHKSTLADFQNGNYYFFVDQGPQKDVSRQRKRPVFGFPFPSGGHATPLCLSDRVTIKASGRDPVCPCANVCRGPAAPEKNCVK